MHHRCIQDPGHLFINFNRILELLKRTTGNFSFEIVKKNKKHSCAKGTHHSTLSWMNVSSCRFPSQVVHFLVPWPSHVLQLNTHKNTCYRDNGTRRSNHKLTMLTYSTIKLYNHDFLTIIYNVSLFGHTRVGAAWSPKCLFYQHEDMSLGSIL